MKIEKCYRYGMCERCGRGAPELYNVTIAYPMLGDTDIISGNTIDFNVCIRCVEAVKKVEEFCIG